MQIEAIRGGLGKDKNVEAKLGAGFPSTGSWLGRRTMGEKRMRFLER